MSEHNLPPESSEAHDEEDFGPSKSQFKREAHAAQALGVSLAELDADALDRLPITDRLRDGIEKLKATRSRGAAKRQRQYIGRLMREEDVEAIEAALNRLDPHSPENQRRQMQAEAWRDALIEDLKAITRFVDSYPAVDVQHLRQLQRGARAESEREEYGKASRALFLEVRAVIEAAGEINEEGTNDT
ncbi:ribosome biogenesis factor YjgA [Guyparkeria sp. SCN-R1]|uniref:ribosome biogenesis factor YjgA n=1 Tax=Guyparkeria sp. SCN-R1 TaxID=2341113 RepID=UPI0013153BC7|nr:ribosome biogenesis factor YjgA [Guyparkeria sp. SCN-R1]